MKEGWILAFIIAAAVAVGGTLYVLGGQSIMLIPVQNSFGTFTNTNKGGFSVIVEGNALGAITNRSNYRITSTEQFSNLWRTIYGTTGSGTPYVDFSKNEVLAVFDGSHSTDGYAIHIDGIKEVAGNRVVTITHTVPGTSCTPMTETLSPFEMIIVPKSTYPLQYTDLTQTKECN